MPSEVSMGSVASAREPTIEELKRELTEAREQQAATTEILAAISSSSTDLPRVFAKIVESAARLCNAYDVAIMLVKSSELHIIGHYGPIPPAGTLPLTRGVVTGRAVLDRQTIHIADLQSETHEYPQGSYHARRIGYHSNFVRADEVIK